MKHPLLLSLLLSLIVIMPAQANPADDAGIKAVENLAKFVPSKKISSLSRKICGQFTGDGSKVAANVKRLIKKHMAKHEGIKNPTAPQIIKFLNQNKNYMTCGHDNQNYMMVSFQHGNAYNQLFNTLFFDELVTDDTEKYIDVNAISFTGPGGKPETVLDYMYREITKGHSKEYIEEVKSLINTFENDLGGKRYADLSPADKAAVPVQDKDK